MRLRKGEEGICKGKPVTGMICVVLGVTPFLLYK